MSPMSKALRQAYVWHVSSSPRRRQGWGGVSMELKGEMVFGTIDEGLDHVGHFIRKLKVLVVTYCRRLGNLLLMKFTYMEYWKEDSKGMRGGVRRVDWFAVISCYEMYVLTAKTLFLNLNLLFIYKGGTENLDEISQLFIAHPKPWINQDVNFGVSRGLQSLKVLHYPCFCSQNVCFDCKNTANTNDTLLLPPKIKQKKEKNKQNIWIDTSPKKTYEMKHMKSCST